MTPAELPWPPGPWYRVLAITTPARAPSAEGDYVTVLPAALSAARHGRPFVTCWLSRGHGAPLELLTNAGPLIPDTDPGAEQGLLFPGGARGRPIGDDWLADLESLVWTPCPGRQAPPLGGAEPGGGRGREPTLFESALVTLMGRPFGWLVVAEPTGLLDLEVAELRTHLNVLRQYAEASERSRFDVERAERRMRELDAFREAGLWRVRVLAGAATAGELRQIAPVLVGSVEIGHHPYRLRSGLAAHGLHDALDAKVRDSGDALDALDADDADDAAHEPATPFLATAGMLAALAGLPRREVPGLRVLDPGYFDVTSETGQEAGTLELGVILDGQERPVGACAVPLASVNRHVFVTGATGSGKSQTVRHLLEQLSRAGVPWLAVEPAKSEYAAMAGRLADLGAPEAAPVTVINPSDPAAVPFSVNPLAPEPGYPVQAHIDMVRALFQAAFDAEEPFPQIMSQALQRVYEDNGWDVVTGGRRAGAAAAPAVPTLEQLQRAAIEVIEDVGYGRELQADVRGFVDVRIRSLRIGSAGRFFEGGHPADIAGLLARNAVLAIEDVANDEDKAFLIGTLIIRVVEHLRLRARRERRPGLRHVIVIEEAHRLLRHRGEERAGAHAVELFAGMLAEIRAYGEGIVVAEQIPTKLVADVVKNTALKVVHRLPAHDDRRLVGAAMNLDDDQSRQVVSLQPGVAAVFADGMDRPLRVRVPLGESREHTLPGPAPPLAGRRSAACGELCRRVRACNLQEIREAELLATDSEEAWPRLWAETVVLAFVTGRPLPAVPGALARRWRALAPRLRECLLATLVERSVGRRAAALRTAFDPERLTAAVAAAATGALSGGVPAQAPDLRWVVPQVRWLHEVDKLLPLSGPAPDPMAPAPPLDYELPGLVDRPEARLGHRLRALRRHPLSMARERNRRIGFRVILGDDEQEEYAHDIDAVTIGVDPDHQVEVVARYLRAPWLEAVLSWPRRFIASFEDDTPAVPFFTGRSADDQAS